MCLSNFKAIRQFRVPISWLRYFTRSYEKTSFPILRRGPGVTRYKWCDTVDWCLRIRHCYEQLLYTDYWEPFSFTNTFVWLRARGSTNNELREDPVDFLEALYQVMSWCNCAPNHYMNPCWHKVATSYGIIRFKWVKQGCDWYVAYNQYHITHVVLIQPINSSPPSDTYMHQWTGSTMVQVMACRLVGAKPLHEPMLTFRELDSQKQTSVKLESKYRTFHSWKCTWKWRLWHGDHFVRGRWVKLSLLQESGGWLG